MPREAWQPMLAMIDDEHTLVSLMAARALVSIDAATAIAQILPVIRDREDWSTPRVGALFREAGPDAVAAPLARLIRSEEPERIPKLIAVLAEIPRAASSELLEALLLRPVDERITAICLRLVQDPELLPLVRRLLAHPRWHLRMGAATVLGRLGLPADGERLLALLADPQWWVRYRAAQALLAIPGLGAKWLFERWHALEDPFARDIVSHVLAEGGPAR